MAFEKHQTALAQPFSLGNGLLSTTMWPYIWYRSRYFFVNNFLKVLLHITELYFIFIFFSAMSFHHLIIFRATTFVIYGAWWGVTEILREAGRHAVREKQTGNLSNLIVHWTWLTLCIALTIDLITLIIFWPNWFTWSQPNSLAFHVYIIAMLFQINLSLLVNTIHSGIYGISRVYRPLWSLLAPNCVSFIVMIAGWFVIDIYALPLAFLVGSTMTMLLSLRYTFSMFTLFNIKLDVTFHWPTFRATLKNIASLESLLAGLSGILITTSSSLFIIIALIFRIENWDYFSFLFLYMILPILQLNVEWAYLFYFDLKKLSRKAYTHFVKRLHHYAHFFSLFISLFAWVLAIIAALIYGGHPWKMLWVLLPWFFIRSFLAYLQMNAFVRRLYADTIISGLIATASLIPFLDNQLPMLYSILFLLIAFVVAIVWLSRRRIATHQRGIHCNCIQPYFLWLNSVLEEKQTMALYRIKLANQTSSTHVLDIIKSLNRIHHQPIWFTLQTPSMLIAIHHAKQPIDLLKHSDILIQGAGLIKQVASDLITPDQIKKALTLTPSHHTLNREQVLREFKHRFPHSIAIPIPHHSDQFSAQQHGHFFRGIHSYIEKQWLLTHHKPYVSAWLNHGVIEMIFVIDENDANTKAAREWQKDLLIINNNNVLAHFC